MFIHTSFLDLHHFTTFAMMYIGPETFMPLLSALAAIAGLLLMFWRNTVAFVRKVLRISPPAESAKEDKAA